MSVSTAQLMKEGKLKDVANVDVLVEKALPVLDSSVKDFEVRRWSLTKADDQWLITGVH